MSRIKQKVTIKEPVRLRSKTLANGNQSLYLDTYRKGKRVYEFLRLYLIPEKTAEDKAVNAATMKAAIAIKAKRIIAFVNGSAGIRKQANQQSLKEWISHIIKDKQGHKSKSSISLMNRLIRHLDKFRSSILLTDADREFCVGFAEYLRSASALNAKKPLGYTVRTSQCSFHCTQRGCESRCDHCQSDADAECLRTHKETGKLT